MTVISSKPTRRITRQCFAWKWPVVVEQNFLCGTFTHSNLTVSRIIKDPKHEKLC